MSDCFKAMVEKSEGSAADELTVKPDRCAAM